MNTVKSGVPPAKSLRARPSVPEEAAAHSIWTEPSEHLENSKRSILEEIRNYPTPIAGCDQQFNYLLEQRDRVSGELSRLACVRRDNTIQETYVEALNDFTDASACIDEELKVRLTAKLRRFGPHVEGHQAGTGFLPNCCPLGSTSVNGTQ